MISKASRSIGFSAIAAVMTLGVSAPANAGGGHGHFDYYSGHYYGGHYYHGGYRRHHRHGHGGDKGAAIALGVIGGAILINELAEEKARRRAYEDRYERRYDRYARRDYVDDFPAGRAYGPDDDPAYDEGPADDRLDDVLEGRNDGGPEPIRLTYQDAYKACTQHARNALGNRGFTLAAPARPETAEDLGGAWKMTATVRAQNGNGEAWSRAMYCEADDRRVYLLELI